MKDLFRETVFGRLLRAASGGKMFGYNEELHLANLQKYQLAEPDSSATSHTLEGKDVNQDRVEATGAEQPSISSQDTQNAIDHEKGEDHFLVTWLPNDADNPRNWSILKKLFVTFQICLLTTSVYIGSAIYTAGLQGVQAQFHVSQVKALLGLTLFVVGYALGPMIWVCKPRHPSGAAHQCLDYQATSLLESLFFAGAHVRSALHRSQPRLRRYPIRLRSPPAACNIRLKHQHAPRLPLHHRPRG